jgi:hypothetical protein
LLSLSYSYTIPFLLFNQSSSPKSSDKKPNIRNFLPFKKAFRWAFEVPFATFANGNTKIGRKVCAKEDGIAKRNASKKENSAGS